MSADVHQARRYLTPPNDTFWRWSKDGTAVEWVDGVTIAFRPELLAVLQRLAEQGLPSLDLVVLLLAACRDAWSSDRSQIAHFIKVFSEHSHRSHVSGLQLAEAVKALDRVAKLSPVLRSTTVAKAELAVVVLGRHAIRTNSDLTAKILLELQLGWPVELDHGIEVIKATGEWIRDLRGLCDGLQRVDEDVLQLLLQTGLEQIIAPAEIEFPEPEIVKQGTVRELLDELERDEEFRGLARLAKYIMAVVHLPRPIADEDLLPLGGVSDISNRGALDRLLLSELANDNDVLMTRVALHEALFLRRERPPSHPPRERLILCDAGLRMWGIPRLFGTIVALSLAAMCETQARIFRASSDRVVPVDLTTRAGLVGHLAALEPAVHPGAALPAFAGELPEGDADVVLISCEDCINDPVFRRLLAESELVPLYVVTVNREGRLRIAIRSSRGERLLREAVLSLKDILTPQKEKQRAEPLVDSKIDRSLPAILRLKSFPLRLSHEVNPRATVCLKEPGSVLSLTQDGRLMLWNESGRGGKQLSDRMPRGHLIAVNEDHQVIRLVVGLRESGRLSLVWVDLNTRDCRVMPLTFGPKRVTHALIHAGNVFVLRPGQSSSYSNSPEVVEIFHRTDGSLRHAMQIPPHTNWNGGRFFRSKTGLHALAYDGLSPRMEVLLKLEEIPGLIAMVFEASTCSGPVIAYCDGSVQVPPESPKKIGLGKARKWDWVDSSRDGNRFILHSLDSRFPNTEFHRVTLPNLQHEKLAVTNITQCYSLLDDPFEQFISHRSWRSRLTGILVDEGRLILVTRRGERLALALDNSQTRLELKRLPRQVDEGLHRMHFFNTFIRCDGVRYRLHAAQWDDGSRAILDSRGLMHFQSSDPTVAEFTIVLHDADVAGWSSSGHCWGSPYFMVLRQPHLEPKKVMETIINPFIARLI